MGGVKTEVGNEELNGRAMIFFQMEICEMEFFVLLRIWSFD